MLDPVWRRTAILHKCLQFLLAASLLTGAFQTAAAQTSGVPPGFADKNRDGVNDLFTDKNGDGINDVTGLRYTHSFPFQDRNRDGINDLWIDEDGDGVNDLVYELLFKNARMVDTDGDGIADTRVIRGGGRDLSGYVLDADRDGKNDITGLTYSGRDFQGCRYGNIDEDNGVRARTFFDADGDGMHDKFAAGRQKAQLKRQGVDLFLDADGDGIADDRGLQRMRGRGDKKGKK